MSDSVADVRVTEVAFPWWVTLVQGIAAVVIGGLLLFQTAATTIILIQFLAWFWLIGGIFEIVSLFWNRAQWGWKLFSGVLGIIVGAFIISEALLGALTLLAAYALLLGIAGIIYGIADIVKAFQGAGWGRGILGAFSLLFGIIIAFNPIPAGLALPWVFGLFAVVFGVAAIVMSFMLRKAQA